jgi:anti-sigma regulatory factor (Ser/Thr protein kinase)
MCLWVKEVLLANNEAPRVARQACSLELSAAIADSAAAANAIEDAEMMTSEMVTHAIEFGAASVELELELHRDYLRLSVTDDSPWPSLPAAAEHGSANTPLDVVDRLAQRWGVEVIPEGLQIWAVILVPRRATVGLPCTVSHLA